jgi:hypothetical protein
MNSFVILGLAGWIGKRLGDSLMSRRWKDLCNELRTPANKPGSRASRVWWLCQNLTKSVLLGIIWGTIGWRVAYSLLRGIDSIALMGTLLLQETGGGLKLVLGQELGLGVQRASSYLGRAHLTYRGLVRQIRGMVRVALPQIRAAAETGWSLPSPLRYGYSSAPGIGMCLEEFGPRLRQIRGLTVRVNP